MKHLIISIFLLASLAGASQVVRIDSTTTTEVRKLYNQAGYQIGKDSISVKKVNGTVDGGDTTIIELTETSLGLTKFRFITIDSLTPYVKTADFAELSEDKIGDKLTVSGYLDKAYNDGTGVTNIAPDTTGTIGLATKYDVASGSGSTNLSITGSASPYTIASSTGTDVVFKAGTNITLSESGDTMTITGSGGGSGLTDEQVRDTVAAFLKVSQEFTKTDADAADSLFIELKLRDVSRIAYTTASHKWINMPSNNTSGGTLLGGVWAVSGTNTVPTKATTTIHTFMNRAELLRTTPATNNVCGIYSNVTTHGFGNASGMGGFYFVGTFGPTTGMSNGSHRGFWGMRNSTSAMSDVDPSTLTNVFGIAWDDDETNVNFMHNDGSGACTEVDLGSGFPVPTADRTNVYRLFMYAEPNGSTVYYKVVNLSNGSTATGSASSNLPSNTTMFTPGAFTSVGGVSAVCGVSVFQLEIFSDF